MSEMQQEAAPEWDVADRMRKSLRHADIDVQEMADYLGMSRTSVSAWINGRYTPSVRTLRLWALRCGVPYEWLTEGETILRVRKAPSRTPIQLAAAA
jgi:transcriptional regulator with XRE-family HTH domain